ncbi:hypothetical protein [Methylocapsa palsarum]|nr:hypothetical protein [Methylocapsa palsarum]
MNRKLFFCAALLVGVAATPVKADASKTEAATTAFLSALTALDDAIQHFRDLVKETKLLPQDIDPICMALNPDPNEPANEDQPTLSDLLGKSNLPNAKAKEICAALTAERGFIEKARAANIGAATECATDRIPACDKINEVLAAQSRKRAEEQSSAQP